MQGGTQMITVTVYKPTRTSETHDFYFVHSAKSWLLLSGYLPSDQDNHFVQVYTGCTATIGVSR